jgi:hypothetical protein
MKIQRNHFACRQLADVEAHPIFIIGLHRSGTTWLYGTLSSLLPVASLSLYHISHYDELLMAHRDGTTRALQKALDTRFIGAPTRGFDEIALSHATVDEYAFVLRRHAGSPFLNAHTLATFKQLMRKLAFVQQRSHVLLKNPWDTRQGAFIATHFPSAKFIFLRRDPVRVLDSQVRALDGIAAGENPLVAFMLQGLPLENMVLSGVRGVRHLLGQRVFRRLLVRLVEKHVRDEIRFYRRSLASVPHAHRVEVSYEDLIADPVTTLKPVVALIGLPLEHPLSTVTATPRCRDLLPEVAARADRVSA